MIIEEDDEDDGVVEMERGGYGENDDDDDEEEKEQQAGRRYTHKSITCNVDDNVLQSSDISRPVQDIGNDGVGEAIDMARFIEVPISAFDIPHVRKNE
jgi:hypothetical protein